MPRRDTSEAARSSSSPRPLARLAQPFQQFVGTESAGGVVLLAAVAVAIVLANSPWAGRYEALLATPVSIAAGPYALTEPVRGWVNDAGMVLFFFLVGLEIKRELAVGELNSFRRAVLPLGAAAGGMVAPALIFLATVPEPALRGGWGVPIATDVAFALGVLTLLGSRVPAGLKVFLLALAIFDDIGAVMVIALFYTHGGVALLPLLLAGLAVLAMLAMARAGVQSIPAYVAAGALAWLAMYGSGVHPTLVGVAIGLVTPWTPQPRAEDFAEEAEALLTSVRQRDRGAAAHGPEARAHTERLARLATLAQRAVSPIDWMERQLHHWVAFLIVPLFALANAGVSLRGDALSGVLASTVGWGVLLGLVLGKPLGIACGAWLAVRAGAELPAGTRWTSVLGVGLVAGIGFTVALFVAGLAYPGPAAAAHLHEAKLGILAGSILSGAAGYLVLRRLGRPSTA